MRKIITSALVLLMVASCSERKHQDSLELSTQKTEIMRKDDKLSIEALLNVYQKALNTSDARLAQSLYTWDGVFMPTEAPSGIGEGIQKSYEFIFSQIQLSIAFLIEEIVVQGNMAFAVTSSKGTVRILATGMEAPESNRELFVFEKVEGEWKIARYMFNKTEPRADN